jgi:lauroyl/myristoyl acyltransferase
MIRLGLFLAGMRLAEWLPPAVLYRLARLVALLWSYVPSAPQRQLRCNLAQVVGLPPTAPAVRRLARQAFQVQAANYVDLLRGRAVDQAELEDRFVRVGDGWPAFEAALRERRGMVLVTAHFGRVELLRQYFGRAGLAATLVVERLEPPALFHLICRLRAQPTIQLVPHDAALRPCLRALARGEAAAFFADWDPTGHGVLVRFFGASARLPAGPAFMALRASVPLFVGAVLPPDPADPLRRWQAFAAPPLVLEATGDLAADLQRGTQGIAHWLEQIIGQYPEQWVMFHHIWAEDGLACEAQAVPGVASSEARA